MKNKISPNSKNQTTLLPDLLGEVILEQEGQDIFDVVECLRQGFIQQRLEPDVKRQKELISNIEGLDQVSLDKAIHAFTTFFI